MCGREPIKDSLSLPKVIPPQNCSGQRDIPSLDAFAFALPTLPLLLCMARACVALAQVHAHPVGRGSFSSALLDQTEGALQEAGHEVRIKMDMMMMIMKIMPSRCAGLRRRRQANIPTTASHTLHAKCLLLSESAHSL
jgi:hypothetical protein